MQFPPDPSALDAFTPTELPAANSSASQKAVTEESILFDKKHADHLRSERVKDVFNNGMVYLVVLAVSIAAALLTLRAAHLVMPTCWLWLSAERLETLDHLGQLIISGTLGGVAYKYFTKQLGEE